MKFTLLLCIFSSVILSSCANNSSKYRSLTNNAFGQGQQISSQNFPVVSETLPDGKVITGKRKQIRTVDNKGAPGVAYYIGKLNNLNQRHGEGAVFYPIKSGMHTKPTDPLRIIRTGQFKNDLAVGLHKEFSMINGIVMLHIFENNKVIKSYGELDALLASGDFETAYKKRGKKVFLGIHLEKKSRIGMNVSKVIYNSPGEMGGFKKNDVILSINGTSSINDELDNFLKKLLRLPYGKKASFRVSRNEKIINLSFVPAIVPKNFAGTESSKSVLWKSIKKKNNTRGYQKYLNTVTDKTYHTKARAALKSIKAKELSVLKTQKKRGIVGLIAFCNQYPDSILLGKELPALYKKIEGKKNFIQNYSKITNGCETADKYQPSYYELLNVGPEGMKVKDALLRTSKGTGVELIATKIKYSNEEYKDFKFDELENLKNFGLHDSIVSAMLESTYKKEQKTAEEYRKRAEQLAAENRRIQLAASRQQASASASSRKTNEKSMPVECIKLVAALKVCDQTSGFLSMGCKAIARSSTECPLPL
jgi:PDZ domain